MFGAFQNFSLKSGIVYFSNIQHSNYNYCYPSPIHFMYGGGGSEVVVHEENIEIDFGGEGGIHMSIQQAKKT